MDKSFEQIADKFAKNIYQTSKGQLRLAIVKKDLQDFALTDSGKPMKILDAGCGLGEIAVWLAQQGHEVTGVELAESMLVQAQQHAAQNAVEVNFICQSIQDYIAEHTNTAYDWIVCHAVVEWLADPEAVIAHLNTLLKPGGKLSLMFFNKTAKLFGNLLYGNFDYIDAGMQVKNQVRLNPGNPQLPEDVYAWVEKFAEIRRKRGVRCFHDYMIDRRMWLEQFDVILEKELLYSLQEPFISLGKYIHVVAEKKQSTGKVR
ncbi:methyltransferase domain-containing protein [Catenovulum sediminis]|uniref:methyltransferase domain-containing protein n=1 Tax=Catenovulum sediminis TaxID=1740262 RepID=UPI00117F90F0|nr:methyltransferase domain-containing protein [Catenovulum sediminis]